MRRNRGVNLLGNSVASQAAPDADDRKWPERSWTFPNRGAMGFPHWPDFPSSHSERDSGIPRHLVAATRVESPQAKETRNLELCL